MGLSSSAAMSMLEAMMFSACEACVSGSSVPKAWVMASRTSGGRLVAVCVISSVRLSTRNCILFDSSAPGSIARLVFSPPELALAAVAASRAFLAAMIRAGVLGAMHADIRRGLVADATEESHRFRHGLGYVLLG